MITAKVLNSQASVNNFKEVHGVDFMLNDSFNLVFRLFDPQLGDRYIPPSTAIVTLTFSNFDTTTFTKVGALVTADDRSMLTVSLAPTDTAQLYGGNVPFVVDVLGDGTQLIYGIIYGALRKKAVTWGADGQ